MTVQPLRQLKHWFYSLQRPKHVQRWREFAAQNTSAPRFAITLFVRNHPGAARDEIVEHLVSVREYSARENCADVVSRNLRQMEQDGQIISRDGGYYPIRQIRFIIRQEDLWFSWFFLTAVGLAIAAFIMSLGMTQYSIHTVLVLVLFAIIFIRIIEDWIHSTPW